MARTSTRRWKGCPMCKPYKDASFGDATRIPYQALKEFPTSDGTRVSRNAPALWGDDGGRDGTWPPDAEFGASPQRRRKNTRRWCRGKPGREHVPVFQPSKWNFRKICRPLDRRDRTWMGGKDDWYCAHAEVCSACGKTLREPWEIGKDCPLYDEALVLA